MISGKLLENDLSDALAIVEQAAAVLWHRDCRRIYSAIKLDIRVGKGARLEQKIRSVKEKIGEVST